jgi:hypothetical protein
MTRRSVLFVRNQSFITIGKHLRSLRLSWWCPWSWHISVLSSTGFELTTLIHCKTNHLALCPAPKATRRHPLYIYMTYHRVCTWSNTTCATNKTGTAYPSFAQEYTPDFLVGFVLHDLSWLTISEIKISSITCLNILETGWQMNRICIANGRIVL